MSLPRTRVDLSALLARCEINYWRLRGLLPEREAGQVREFVLDSAIGRLRCRFEIEAIAPYTTVLRVRQPAQSSPWLPTIDMQVRVCHDAEVAEVVMCQGVRHIRPAYDYPNDAMHQPDEKKGWNAFLGEWLALCHRHGREVEPRITEGLDA